MVKDIKVVIGANYGDEGKGLMTSYFAREASKRGETVLNILSNGGAQRGHTVDMEDGSHFIFHHFGSGSPYGATTYIPNEFILNPMQFVKEDEELSDKHIPHKAMIEGNNMWSTPYDMIFNQLEALASGGHNTCGMGIWSTICRYESDRVEKLTINDFCKLSYQKQILWLNSVKSYYQVIGEDILSRENRPISNELLAVWNSPNLADHFIADCLRLRQKTIISPFQRTVFYDTIIFENAQGLMLDKNIYGQEEFNTPSMTGFEKVAQRIDDLVCYRDQMYSGSDYNCEVCYVSRTYLTRHGDGIFRGYKGDIHRSEWENNIYNTFQGDFKMKKILDHGEIISRVNKDFENGLRYIYAPRRKNFRRTIAFTHANEAPLSLTNVGINGCNYLSKNPIEVVSVPDSKPLIGDDV